MPIILSTMSNTVDYCIYKKTPSGVMTAVKTITVNGGSNVMNKHFITPQGVSTTVSDEDLELLLENDVFNAQKAAGFIKIQKKATKGSDDKKTSDMAKKDASAQLTESDFDQAPVKVKTNAGE